MNTRIDNLERGINRMFQAPTIPIYGTSSGSFTPPPPPPVAPKILTVGNSGIYHSDDGITWNHSSGPFDGSAYTSCTYMDNVGLWVVGTGYNLPAPNIIITSPDGINWTAQNSPWDGSSAAGWTLTYSPSLGLAVAGANGRSDLTSQIMTSTDGVTWTEVSSPYDANSQYMEDIKWIPFLNKFILVTDQGRFDESCIATSSDGITWTPVSSTGLSNPPSSFNRHFMFGVGHSGSIVYALGSFSSTPSDVELSSSDAITWTLNSEGSTPYNVYSLAYNSGSYVRGVNKTGVSLQHSTDGTSWSDIVGSGTGTNMDYCNRVIWSPNANAFIAVGGDGPPSTQGCMLTSPNGTTWSDPFGHGMLFDVWDIDIV